MQSFKRDIFHKITKAIVFMTVFSMVCGLTTFGAKRVFGEELGRGTVVADVAGTIIDTIVVPCEIEGGLSSPGLTNSTVSGAVPANTVCELPDICIGVSPIIRGNYSVSVVSSVPASTSASSEDVAETVVVSTASPSVAVESTEKPVTTLVADKEKAAKEDSEEIILEEVEEVKEVEEDGNNYNATNAEEALLCRLVQCEAGGEDRKGKILVANVVMNRVASSEFPDSIKGVVYAGDQFTPVGNGKINRVKVSKETKEAVRAALSGKCYTTDALFFNSGGENKTMNHLFDHGGHHFYSGYKKNR